jgi:branched-chain amino acid transport system ATP-binding protein
VSTGAPLLRLSGVHAYYGLAHVLQGVDLEVKEGELVALLGRNGAGKTTTIRSVMGLVSVREGTIGFDGHELTRLATHRIARMGIAYVPEDRRMFPGLSVEENLRLAAIGAGLGAGGQRRALNEALELFPALREHANREAARLSGGQQQMVAIARALVAGPRLLLIDEPTQGLAPIVAAGIGETLSRIAGSGVGVLLVEQNAVMALRLASRAYVIDEGTIKASGIAEDISNDAHVKERYLAV